MLVRPLGLAGHLLPFYGRSYRRTLLLRASGALRCYATFVSWPLLMTMCLPWRTIRNPAFSSARTASR